MKTRLPALFALTSALLAQPAQQFTVYKLDFTVREVEGSQTVSSKTYSTLYEAGASNKCTIRTGSKVPVTTTPGSTQFLEVGTSIDANNIKDTGSALSLLVTAEITTAVRDAAAPSATPVIRQNKWTSEVSVPFRKQTILFTADDPASKRQVQLELTVGPVK